MQSSFARASALAVTTLALTVAATSPARAHFILSAPPASKSQDSLGNPQKTGPCGEEGGGTATGAITAYQPGDTVTITVDETVFHPGHYRVALAVNDPSELPAEPPVTPGASACGTTVVQDPPAFPILADGQLDHTKAFSGPQTFSVKLPTNVTCSHCTLQVLEFMSSHGAPCFYHHCATISIGTGTSSAGADASTTPPASSTPPAASSDAGAVGSSSDGGAVGPRKAEVADDGCALGGSGAGQATWLFVLGSTFLVGLARRRPRR